MVSLKECPLCSHTVFELYLSVKDQLVSGEEFTLVKCNSCSFVFTNPRPSVHQISQFYQSNEYISHAGKSQTLMDRLYFLVRQIMFHRKLKWLKKYTDRKKPLLDYGCGTATFIKFLVNKHWDARGMEPNDAARSIALQNAPGRVVKSTASLSKNEFGTITLWHVLEHLYHLEKDLMEILDLLMPSGHLIIAVPNCRSADASHYGNNWAGYDVPRHLSHFTPETMKLLARKHQLKLIKQLPLKFDAYYISILSEKYMQGNMLQAFEQGFKSNLSAKKHEMNYSSLVYVFEK